MSHILYSYDVTQKANFKERFPCSKTFCLCKKKISENLLSCFPMAPMVIFTHSFMRPCLWVDDGLTKKLTSNRATIRNVFRFSTEQLCNRYREGRFCSTRQLHNNPLGCISSAQQFSSVRVKTFFTRSKKKWNSIRLQFDYLHVFRWSFQHSGG